MRRTMIWAMLAIGGALAGCSNGSPTEAAAAGTDDSRLAIFAASCPSPAPLYLAPAESRVPDAFIVVYDDALAGVDARTSRLAARYGFTTTFRWEHALKGFAATLPPSTVRALRCEAGVRYIEEDAVVTIEG
ncbi:MAG TPA: protease inhibitor I9 family protein [Gemmatimonadaceae bacterium]|nr:protease inhibitor I9 family protein [Gemmatimonadaceae bacterium]